MREIQREAGCEPLYLSLYSQDLNPIELAFSKTKRLMRRVEARTRETVVEAIDRALEAVTEKDGQGFFGHNCGYRTVARPLWQTL